VTPTRTILDPPTRQALLDRFRHLNPGAAPRWGRMTAPRMLAHLSDQMRHTLGDAPAAPRRGPLRWPVLRHVAMFWLPWPRGYAKGPPEAFLTKPTTWDADLATFLQLVNRFVEQEHRTEWPEHAFFGPMTRNSWGRFCHRHFEYHLQQFGG
jgi:hypothetical protein